jgi:hypothetical protein
MSSSRPSEGRGRAPARPSRQVNDRLQVREEPEAYFVVLEHDDADWLVKFDKSPDFAARQWAINMAESYNERYDDPRMDAVKRNAPPPRA